MKPYHVETTVDAFPDVPAFSDSLMNAIAEGNLANAEFIPEIPWAVDPATLAPARFSANRKALVNRLKAVSGFCAKRSPKPILQTVKISINGTVELTATDLERSIVTVDDSPREGDKSGLVYPARLLAVLKGMKCQDVECELTAEQLTIRGNNSALSVPVEFPVAEYPAIGADHREDDIVIVVNAADLLTGLQQTVFATDSESTRYALGGVLFQLAGIDSGEHKTSPLTLAATDTRRMAVHHLGAVDLVDGDPCKDDTFVVPSAFLAAVSSFVEDSESVEIRLRRPVHETIADPTDENETITQDVPGYCTFTGSGYKWSKSGWCATSRLVEGRFPRWQDVVPASHDRELAFDKADLLEAIQTAAIACSEESRGLDFEIPDASGDCIVTIRGRSPGHGESTASVGAGQVIRGPHCPVITFDPCYIVEYLRALPKSCKYVQLAITNENCPGVLTAADMPGLYLVMPLSRDR